MCIGRKEEIKRQGGLLAVQAFIKGGSYKPSDYMGKLLNPACWELMKNYLNLIVGQIILCKPGGSLYL